MRLRRRALRYLAPLLARLSRVADWAVYHDVMASLNLPPEPGVYVVIPDWEIDALGRCVGQRTMILDMMLAPNGRFLECPYRRVKGGFAVEVGR